jgi:hypothetical protein
MMGGLFSRPKEPTMPKPDPPVAPATTVGEAAIRKPSKAIGSRRGRTILAGALRPYDIFKKDTLG